MFHCGASKPSRPERRSYESRLGAKNIEKLLAKDNGETLKIPVRWVVLYTSDPLTKVGEEYVQANHQMLRDAFLAKNTEELERVPAQFKDIIGNPNIEMHPMDERKVKVEYIKIDSNLSSSAPVEDAASRAGIKQGFLNLYIGPGKNGGILGQAELSSNIVFGLYSTVGSIARPGILLNFNLGKSMIHEAGHALGLQHTFSDDTCDNIAAVSDSVEQVNPNFSAQLIRVNGVWTIVGDNRDRDRKTGSKLSCLHLAASEDDKQKSEMIFNYLDYMDDPNSFAFSISQCILMRDTLRNMNKVQNPVIQLINDDFKSPYEYDTPKEYAASPSVNPNATATSSSTSYDLGGSEESETNLTMIIILSLGAVALIGTIIFVVRWKSKASQGYPAKNLEAYTHQYQYFQVL